MTKDEINATVREAEAYFKGKGLDMAPITDVSFMSSVQCLGKNVRSFLGPRRNGEIMTCRIVFSKQLLTMEAQKARDIIYHEVLHCFRKSHGHDFYFRLYADIANRELGMNISVYVSQEAHDEMADAGAYNYVVRCPKCGVLTGFARKANVVKELLARPDSTRFGCHCGHRHLVLDYARSKKLCESAAACRTVSNVKHSD